MDGETVKKSPILSYITIRSVMLCHCLLIDKIHCYVSPCSLKNCCFNVRLLATNMWPGGCTLSMYAMSQFTNSSTLALVVALYTCSTALGSEFFHALHISWHRGSATGQRVWPRSWQGVGWRSWEQEQYSRTWSNGKIKGLVNPGHLVLHSGVLAFIQLFSTY